MTILRGDRAASWIDRNRKMSGDANAGYACCDRINDRQEIKYVP